MRRWLSLIGMALPYGFFALYADAVWGSVAGYAAMFLALAMLSRSGGWKACIAGNTASLLISLSLVKELHLDRWDWYFKPFGASGLLWILWLAALVLQLLLLWRKKRCA